jgi:aminoglycoside phosphotransferase (APT) family kinase protein
MKGQVIAKGRTAEIIEWDDGQVLKLFYDWVPSDWIEREPRIVASVCSAGLPVPKTYAIVELNGRRGIVYQRLVGPSLLTSMSGAPWKVGRFAKEFARLHLSINQVHGGDLPSLVGYLRQSIERAVALSTAQKNFAWRTLDALPEGDRLCHFDFHPDQVILTNQGPRIIDWVTASKGDPAADVARTLVLTELGSVEHLSPAVRFLVKVGKHQFMKSYLAAYTAGAHIPKMETVGKWRIPVLAARLVERVPQEEKRILELLDVAANSGNA